MSSNHIHPSIHQFQSIYPLIHLHLHVCPSIKTSEHPSTYPFHHPSTHLFTYPSTNSFINPTVPIFLIEKIMQKRTNDSCNLFSKIDSSQHFLHYQCKLIQSSIYLFINLFNHIFICSFTHSTNHPTINTTPCRRPPPCPSRRLHPPCLCDPPCRRPPRHCRRRPCRCPCPPPCSRPLTRVLLLVLLHLQKL